MPWELRRDWVLIRIVLIPRVLTRGIELYLVGQIPYNTVLSRIRIDIDYGISDEPWVLDWVASYKTDTWEYI